MAGRIDAVLKAAVERGDVPGVVAVAVNRDGVSYEGAFGQARAAENLPMRIDTIFPIFSMTKGLTSLAAMQLVDEGKLSLDARASDVDPDLKALSILADDGELRPATKPVTLRHFLTHTCGFCYTFTTPGLAEELAKRDISWLDPQGGLNLRIPLSFEPGARWHYGLGTDWAGRLVEQASGMSLPQYMTARVFEPLGMTETAFECREGWQDRLVAGNQRAADGSLVEQPLRVPPPSRSGGGGLLSSAPSYARFLRFMLGDGSWESDRIVTPEAMTGLCSDQVPGMVAGRAKTGVPALSNDFDFTEGGTTGHSLGFLYNRKAGRTGRSEGTLGWAGLANCYYWIDRAAGIAGAVFMQVLPFADKRCIGLRDAFERAVYAEARA